MTSLYSHDIVLGFILVGYQTRLREKYLVFGYWSQSTAVVKRLYGSRKHRPGDTTVVKVSDKTELMCRLYRNTALRIRLDDIYSLASKIVTACLRVRICMPQRSYSHASETVFANLDDTCSYICLSRRHIIVCSMAPDYILRRHIFICLKTHIRMPR